MAEETKIQNLHRVIVTKGEFKDKKKRVLLIFMTIPSLLNLTTILGVTTNYSAQLLNTMTTRKLKIK